MYLTNKYYDNNTQIGNCGGGGDDHDGFSIPYSWQSQKWEQNKQKRWIQQQSNPIQMWTEHIRIACKKARSESSSSSKSQLEENNYLQEEYDTCKFATDVEH
jgi:hypothetical protein